MTTRKPKRILIDTMQWTAMLMAGSPARGST